MKPAGLIVGGARSAPPTRPLRLLSVVVFVVVVACAFGVLGVSSNAHATILPPQVLAGPSASILDVDGSAMAPDGSGGVVYRQIVDGEPTVMVDQYVNGAWQPPVQVDAGSGEPQEEPAIAAADGGELVVVWVQPYEGVQTASGDEPQLVYRLMSAVLDPGASSFSDVEPVDEVGAGTAVDPQVVLSPNGSTGYVVYRVVTNPLAPGVQQPVGTPAPTDPGDQLVDVRVAKFDGAWWSGLGAVNAYDGVVSDRDPTTSNAPSIAIVGSDAEVVWQEPDLTGYARIWERLVYGSTLGPAYQLSPSSVNGAPVDVDADAPSVAYGGAVVFRLEGGAGSPYGDAPQLFEASDAADAPYLPVTADQLESGSSLGQPDVGADLLGDIQLAAVIDGQAALTTFPVQVSNLGAATGGQVFVVPDPDGGGSVAWQGTDGGGLPVVDAFEQYPDGATQTASLSAPVSGEVTGLSVGDSLLGSGLVGWLQGPADQQQVMGAVIAAPPETYVYELGGGSTGPAVTAPTGWVKPAKAKITWSPAVTPLADMTYELAVDGQVRVTGIQGPSAFAPVSGSGLVSTVSRRLPSAGLGTGKYKVQVLAVDSFGQVTSLGTVTLKVDDGGPQVKVTFVKHHRGVKVKITDPQGPGVVNKDSKVTFGDRTTKVTRKDTITHVYKRRGRYRITVKAEDKAKIRRTAKIEVRVK